MKIRRLIPVEVIEASEDRDVSVYASDSPLPSRIQLLMTGDWKTPYHGNFEITPEDMTEYVSNFNAEVRASGGLPINLDHEQGPAAGWITSLTIDPTDNSLWGEVEWTPLGQEKLSAKEYRFISPEFCPVYEDPQEAGSFMKNVMVGAGLTNTPLFTQLKPLMANRENKNGISNIIYAEERGTDSMNLDEILAKESDALSEDERKFLVDHESELSAENKQKFGLANPDDGQGSAPEGEAPNEEKPEGEEAGQVAASTGTVSIKASELAELKLKAESGEKAWKELQRKEASEFVAKHQARGAIKASEVDKTVELILNSPDQGSMKSFIESLPSNELVAAGEKGKDDKGSIGTAAVQIREAIEKVMADDKLSHALAVKKVMAEKPELYKEYEAEVELSANGQG